MRQRIAVKPRTQQEVPGFLSRHGGLAISDSRLEQSLKLGLVLGGDERQADIRNLVGRFGLPPALRLRYTTRLERRSHLTEPRRLRLHGRGRRRRESTRWLRRGLRGDRRKRRLLWLRGLELLLLLLLLELLLILLGDSRHRRGAGLETLLRRSLAEPGRLGLELPAKCLLLRHTGWLRLHTRISCVLLLQRSLTKACRLRSERTGLLLLLLLLRRLTTSQASEGIAILLGTWAQVVGPAQEGVRVRVHRGVVTSGRTGKLSGLGDYGRAPRCQE